MPANALLRARFQRLLSLLLLLSCGPSSGVRVSPWRAVAHRLSPRLSDRGAALPGAFSPLRGNLMFWKLHKVGGTTLRHILLRHARGANLTVGVLGCAHQRTPLRAHLSVSHVVCPEPTRDYALTALLGQRHSEVVFVRDPLERALSALYYIIMSQRRTDAVNALGCSYNLSYAGRDFSLEVESERGAFAAHGYQALQTCALRYRGGAAAHVRVFQPQWSYWAADAAASLSYAERRSKEEQMFVGSTESFDASLVLLARWLGVPFHAMRYASRQRAYGTGHPGIADWNAADVRALRAATEEGGEASWHAGMLRIAAATWAALSESEELASDVKVLAALNAQPRSAAEVAEERAAKEERRQRRPV